MQRQQSFGITSEEINEILVPMVLDKKEPLGAMGADWPLAILSHQSQHLSNYFKQLFAQVTNPPLDGIREELVTQVSTSIGPESNLLTTTAENCRHIQFLYCGTTVLSL